MKKNSTLLYILTLTILSTGCSNKKCTGPNAHDGLYNALTCDYDNNIQVLALKLDTKTLERNQLFHNYQRLIAQVTNKQSQIKQLEEEILLIENDMKSVLTLMLTNQSEDISLP